MALGSALASLGLWGLHLPLQMLGLIRGHLCVLPAPVAYQCTELSGRAGSIHERKLCSPSPTGGDPEPDGASALHSAYTDPDRRVTQGMERAQDLESKALSLNLGLAT